MFLWNGLCSGACAFCFAITVLLFAGCLSPSAANVCLHQQHKKDHMCYQLNYGVHRIFDTLVLTCSQYDLLSALLLVGVHILHWIMNPQSRLLCPGKPVVNKNTCTSKNVFKLYSLYLFNVSFSLLNNLHHSCNLACYYNYKARPNISVHNGVHI